MAVGADDAALVPHTPVGRYRIERLLGTGATGAVYQAVAAGSGQTVALKILHREAANNPVLVRRLWREAKAALIIKHPGVVRILDAFAHEGTPVLVLEYLEGESLEELLERRGTLPLPELAPLLLQVIAAVSAAHQLGVVHRDLKPGNIVLCDAAGQLVAKILDFGVAKLTATEGAAVESLALTTKGMLLGTPFYMSPEQAMGQPDIDQRADIWALGIILYRALTGVLPTHGKALGEVFRKVVRGEIPPIDEIDATIPPPLAEQVSRMLAVRRDDRPKDLEELRRILERCCGDTAPQPGQCR